MAIWGKILAGASIAFLELAAASCFWSLVKLPEFFRAIMSTPSDLDLLHVATFTGFIEVDPSRERKMGYPSLLFADVSSSLAAWRKGRNIAFAFCVLLLTASWFLGYGYLVVTLAVFLSKINGDSNVSSRERAPRRTSDVRANR